MPDYTVKADVDTMLRANDKAGIRSAIGVGTTDAPTFLAQTLTGQSLTGTQATSLVDLSATWNTTGTPSAIKLNVTDTASDAASKLLDLQVGTVSRFFVNKDGLVFSPSNGGNGGGAVFGGGVATNAALYTGQYGIRLASDIGVAWSASRNLNAQDTFIYRDAAGILAQRNGVNKQVHRVYNTFLGTTANEWGGFDWLTTTNTLRIGTEHGGTGVGRTIHFVIGGIPTWVITTSGHLQANTDNAYDIGASGANRPRNIYAAGVFNFGLINGALPGGTIYGGHIGTSQYFAIKGTSTVASTIYIQNGSSGDKTGWVRVLGSGSVDHGALEVGALDSSPVIFTTALTERMRLSAAGNFGIGTTSPTSKLQVSAGDIEVDTIAKGVILKSPDGTRYRVTVPNGGAVLTITAV